VVDRTPPPCHPGGPDDGELEPRASVFTGSHWTLFFGVSSRKQGAGAGGLLITLIGEQFKYMVHLDFKATNNMAEYETLIFGLSTALLLGVQQLLVKGDSQLVIKQVEGECSCHVAQLVAYLLHLQHIPRANNAVTDEVSMKAPT
jgi:ribonuclease HI